MRKITYPAVLEPNSSGGYSVYFPDLLGCISAGESEEDARRSAAEALSLHLWSMETDGDEIPPPSENPEIDPETEPGFKVVPVTAYPDMIGTGVDITSLPQPEISKPSVRYARVAIPADLYERAEKNGISLSFVLCKALQELFDT